jgi:hypothetical protein
MPNAWVVDLRHYLTDRGAMAPMPAPARKLAEYFASIVLDATADLDAPPAVRCRRRLGQRPCTGIVNSYFALDESDCIRWHCPACGDHGLISGWQGTLWDATEDVDSTS